MRVVMFPYLICSTFCNETANHRVYNRLPVYTGMVRIVCEWACDMPLRCVKMDRLFQKWRKKGLI